MTFGCTKNTQPQHDDTHNYDEEKLNMHSLMKIVAAKDGLVNLRDETTNAHLFTTVVNYCLIYLTTSVQLRYHAYNTTISDIVTVSDEALCVLIIENHADSLYAHMMGDLS